MTHRIHPLSVAVLFALANPVLAADAPLDPATLDEVEVEAAPVPVIEAERLLTPGGVTVIDGEALEERAVYNLADALRYVPGLWTESSSGGDAVFFSSRGSNLDATNYDTNGIKMLQDGLPVTTADGNNHNRFLDPVAARMAVIARGANALTYGASTLGGAIDFTTPTARNTESDEVFVSAGSHGAARAHAAFGGVAGNLDGFALLEGSAWEGYRDHSSAYRTGVYANGGWQGADDFGVRLYATHVDSEEELPGALTRAQVEADPDQAAGSAIGGDTQLNVDFDRVAAKGTWAIDANRRLEFGLSHEQQSLYHPIVDKVLVDFDGPGPDTPVEVFSLLKNTDQRTTGGMLRYNVVAGAHDVLIGANLADTHETGGNYRNDGGRRNGLTGIVDNRAESVEVFAMDRWRLRGGWTLVYGAQGVHTMRDVSTTAVATGNVVDPEGDYSSFNPRLGAIYALGAGSEAYGSISRLYEAPTNFELQDDARGDGSTLDAMHGVAFEAGLRGDTGESGASRWFWDASVYYAAVRDEILSVEDPDAPGTSLSANIDRTTHAGLEAVLGASLEVGTGGGRIEPLVSATWNAFSFDNDDAYGDNDLPAAPEYVLRGEVLYRTPGGFFAGPTFDFVGARYADFQNTYRVGSYELLGLRAGFEREAWEVFAEARNLLDEDYIATLNVRERASITDALLQPGAPRSVYFGVRYRF